MKKIFNTVFIIFIMYCSSAKADCTSNTVGKTCYDDVGGSGTCIQCKYGRYECEIERCPSGYTRGIYCSASCGKSTTSCGSSMGTMHDCNPNCYIQTTCTKNISTTNGVRTISYTKSSSASSYTICPGGVYPETFCANAETTYECDVGYYGSPTNSTSGCTRCPVLNGVYGTTDSTGKKYITDCYVTGGPFSDTKGTYTFSSDCYYSN